MIHPSSGMEPSDPITEQPSSEAIGSNYLAMASQSRENLRGSEDGLGILEGTQHLFIKQTVVASEMFYNAANRFEILNSFGVRILLGVETTDFKTRICFGSTQPFELSVYNARPIPNNNANESKKKKKYLEILKMDGRPGGCRGHGRLTVTDGKNELGTIQQTETSQAPKFSVKDSTGKEILLIQGPPMRACCAGFGPMSGSVEFDVLLTDGETTVGKIAKQWGGFFREFFTRADIWGIKFSPDMTCETKSLLLAAVFLLDFQFFER